MTGVEGDDFDGNTTSKDILNAMGVLERPLLFQPGDRWCKSTTLSHARQIMTSQIPFNRACPSQVRVFHVVELLSISSASFPCNTSRYILRTHNLALLGNSSTGSERKRCCAGYEDQNYNILGYIVEKVCDPAMRKSRSSHCVCMKVAA